MDEQRRTPTTPADVGHHIRARRLLSKSVAVISKHNIAYSKNCLRLETVRVVVHFAPNWNVENRTATQWRMHFHFAEFHYLESKDN